MMKEPCKMLYKHTIGEFDIIWQVSRGLCEEILGERKRTFLDKGTGFVKTLW